MLKTGHTTGIPTKLSEVADPTLLLRYYQKMYPKKRKKKGCSILDSESKSRQN